MALVYKMTWYCLGENGEHNQAAVDHLLVGALNRFEHELEAAGVRATWILDTLPDESPTTPPRTAGAEA